ncbi:MAG TPA: YicC/YloC family endoribonuclease [Alphaproteobacteria bacterium]|nr:YicC/YloC family endoribonuclease [Alphaproteobacteria bacterium]
MSISSMTGYARAVGHDEALSWTWEVKSVNGRTLDIRFRLPLGMDRLEVSARGLVNRYVKRGSLTASLQLSRAGAGAAWRVNRELIERFLALHEDYAGRIAPGPLRLDTLLTVRGVVEQVEESEGEEAAEERGAKIMASFETALAALAAARAAEGGQLAKSLAAQLEQIARLTSDAEALAALSPPAVAARIKEQVATLLAAEPQLSEERLAQEAALIAAKADVREELDRLKAHIVAARELLASADPVGRRLDFLCQEFNREANTLCSKAADVALTRLGLELKAVIEQLREQVQNIE